VNLSIARNLKLAGIALFVSALAWFLYGRFPSISDTDYLVKGIRELNCPLLTVSKHQVNGDNTISIVVDGSTDLVFERLSSQLPTFEYVNDHFAGGECDTLLVGPTLTLRIPYSQKIPGTTHVIVERTDPWLISR
jgi:hypothetical protein